MSEGACVVGGDGEISWPDAVVGEEIVVVTVVR